MALALFILMKEKNIDIRKIDGLDRGTWRHGPGEYTPGLYEL